MKHGYGVITYNYDTAMNQLLEYKEDTDNDGEYELGVEYAYDKQGNPVTKVYKDLRTGQSGRETAREEYTWNDRGELTQIQGRVTESYVYDYRGLRHIKDNDANTYKYVYLQNSQPAFKHDVSNNTYDVYVYEGTRRVARVRIDGTGNTNTETFINNYQGSPVAVLSDAGEIKYQKYLDPWGNMEMEIGYPSSNIEFQYTDKELDEDTGLYNFHARYRDPVDNRFYGRDRVKLEDNLENYFGINPYVFVNNNPVRYVDAEGNKIVIAGNDQKAQEGLYGALVDLSGLPLTMDDNGQIDILSGPSKYKDASALVSEIVNSSRIIKIKDTMEGSNAPYWLNEVNLNLNDRVSVPTKLGKHVYNSAIPKSIELGHELIHIKHDLGGAIRKNMAISAFVVPNNIYKGIDAHANPIYGETRMKELGQRLYNKQGWFKEEFLTVGVGGYNNVNDITENSLRLERGLGIRTDY
jgi:RHS repeat-associated protein